MNILAEKQWKVLERGVSEEERRKREKVFLDLYYKLRAKEEKSFLSRMSLSTKRKLHNIALMVLKIKNRLSGLKYEIIKDERTRTARTVIFAVTHVSKSDIEIVYEAIKDHCYLLTGDFERLQGRIESLFLAVNGVIYFNQRVKEDRKNVVSKMIEHLKAGGNLMYFPEGVWNVSPNLPVLPCYWGIVEVARKSNAVIVPVAVEQYGKQFKVNIGRNFDMSVYGDVAVEKAKAITDLRDVLATLKWEIWESEPVQERSKIKGDEWGICVEKRIKEWYYYSLEYIDGLTYKPKGITLPEEAFSHLNNIKLTKDNAFLWK